MFLDLDRRYNLSVDDISLGCRPKVLLKAETSQFNKNKGGGGRGFILKNILKQETEAEIGAETDCGRPRIDASRASLEAGGEASLKGRDNFGVRDLVRGIGDGSPGTLGVQKARNINYKLMEGARRLKELGETPVPKPKSKSSVKRLKDGGPLKQTTITSFKAKWRALQTRETTEHEDTTAVVEDQLTDSESL